MSVGMERMQCDRCFCRLEEGRIGLCDECLGRPVVCGNVECDWEGYEGRLEEMAICCTFEREVPAGMCPKCGGMAFLLRGRM